MLQPTDTTSHSPLIAAESDTPPLRLLILLLGALIAGAVFVWQVRQQWVREHAPWLWLPFVATMVASALALRRLEAWLPGEAVPASPVVRPGPARRWAGLFCVAAAAATVGEVAFHLWPDYHTGWHEAVLPWAAALVLVPVGGWLLGAAGEASAGATQAVRLWPDTRTARLLEAAAFVLILALAIFLRTYRLDSIPSGIYVDETNGALDALYILEGRPDSPFGTGWYETPSGYIYYMAGVFKLLGVNWTSLKVVSLLPAILTVPAVYLLGRLLFGPLVGLYSMLLMAASRWHLSMSRWGWNETAPPLFQVLALFFLIRGLRDRRALDYTLGGLLTGLSIYTYLSSRLAAVTLVLFVAYWLVSDPHGWLAALRRCWAGLALFAAAALVALAPLAVTYITNPFSFGNRVSEISIFRDVSAAGNLKPLLDNIGDVLKFFHQTGDLQGKHNLPGEPMTDPVTGLLFAVGLVVALQSWRSRLHTLLVIWLVLGLAGSFLSSRSESPQAYRSMTALPAMILLAALTLDQCVRALYRLLRERPALARTPLPALVAGATAAAALAGAALWEANTFFGRQAESISVIRGFNPTENQVAHDTLDALRAGTTVYVSPRFFNFSPLRFLIYGAIKEQSGANTLEQRPYRVVVPEVSFPLSDSGGDVLLLLDSEYWPLRGYIASFYPEARMELVRLTDDAPIYMRVRIAREQVAALQGLNERVTYVNGHIEERDVAQVQLANDAQVAEVEWSGALRLARSGVYDLLDEGGLQIFVDGERWEGKHYLGRGLYTLRVVRPPGARGARLNWQAPGQALAPVPPEMLFRVAPRQQGLLGAYYANTNWEGAPLFKQLTPFLLLSWPDERPVVPDAPFSARYTGFLRVTEEGTYVLSVAADDGARLTLDGQVLGVGLVSNNANTFEATVELAPGDHPIQVDYFQQTGGTQLSLFWRRGDQPREPVPPSALIPPR